MIDAADKNDHRNVIILERELTECRKELTVATRLLNEVKAELQVQDSQKTPIVRLQIIAGILGITKLG